MEEVWYRLDNAAKIYPAIRESDWAPIFRIDAVLKDNVNPDVLQSALLITYKRFPTFSVHINKGLFWYYFEPNESEPEVKPEGTYPAAPFDEERDKGYLFRVLYYNRRISLEIFHSITDGFGATVFLRTLLYNYFSLIKGKELVENPLELEKYNILYYKDSPTPDEVEDSFQYFAVGKDELKLKENVAFKIPGTRIEKNSLKVLHVLLNIKSLHRLARSFDTTITEFLTSLFIYAILNARVYKPGEKKPIKISVPINLRRRFSSKTMRNFSSYINVEFFPQGEPEKVEFNEICGAVLKQIRDGADIEVLRSKFTGNVKSEKNIMMRAAPLFLKNIVLKTVYSLYGERIITSTISNIGNVELPESITDMIERFDFLLGEPKENAYNCAVISFNDTISISFTSIISENIVLKKFVDFLVSNGLQVKIEGNY